MLALVLFSLIGIVSTSMVTGNPIDTDSISNDVRIALETAVSAYGSHWPVRSDSLVVRPLRPPIRRP